MVEASNKMPKQRILLALACGLAVCCSVMYLTTDGESEHAMESVKGVDAGTSVGSTDVLKAGQIYTETPDGRMRLMDYFNNVESEISSEQANRRADIASVRAEMARDFSFNAQARRKLRTQMLTTMKRNAKKCKDDLNKEMRHTQERFFKSGRLANRRYKATLRRDRNTVKLARRNKREAARNLRLAVNAWTRSTSSWAAKTNAHINRMNKHVAANAAQIVENAKRARKDLNGAMNKWNQKINSFTRGEKAANSKLGVQFANQDKATRAWANNKIKGMVANTAAQFNSVMTKMAKNRHEVDMALRQATMRFAAAMNAQKALENKRFAQTVRNIQAARTEAKKKINDAKSEFHVSLLSLSSVVKEQVSKVNDRIDKTAGVVRSNAAAQAKVNANVNAETKRMISLGNRRYKAHMKNDLEMHKLISKGKAETNRKLNKMALDFNTKLGAVRRQLKKDRAHSETMLRKKTAGLWAQLQKQQLAQRNKNREMEAATRRMRLDSMAALRKAKKDFKKRIHKLAVNVAKNDRKANKKISKLTGVVRKNAVKSRRGRGLLHALAFANKKELRMSIRGAIAKGQKRAKQMEKGMKKFDKDTKWLMQNKLAMEITRLRKQTDNSINSLRMQDARARKELKEEMVYAIKSFAKIAKKGIKRAVSQGVTRMFKFQKAAATSRAKSLVARQALARRIARNAKEVARMTRDAVATNARSQAALLAETAKKIKKTNNRVDAYAQRMKDQAKKTRAGIKALSISVIGKVRAEQIRAANAIAGFSMADAKRQKQALKFMKNELQKAAKAADRKFGKAQRKLAADRAHFDRNLGSSTTRLNQALAKQAALADSRFSKTVANLAQARKEAAAGVAQMRKDFATQLQGVNAEVKNVETRVVGQITTVSGEVISFKNQNARVNARAEAEMKRILKISDKRFSQSARARGRLKALMDENKAAAAAEVRTLSTSLESEIKKARDRNARIRLEMAKDLSKATTSYYGRMNEMQNRNEKIYKKTKNGINAAAVASRNALNRAKATFETQMTMVANTVAANAKRAERATQKLTGVVHNIAKASVADRKLIKDQVKTMQADLQKSIVKAISIGQARGSAMAQRLNIRLKNTKKYLQVEVAEKLDRAADNVFKVMNGKRQKIADNYLSFKAYAVSAMDKVTDYVGKGKGRNLASIGDLLQTVGALGAVKPPKASGLGLGGKTIRTIFSGKKVKVGSALASINGLVNEYSSSCAQVRARFPLGIGKYLLGKLENSMVAKGVLQVDKVAGKRGNFVYINGRSVGLSNKLNDFATLASRMSVYENVLAKLTASLKTVKAASTKLMVPPPEYDGK